MTSRPSTGPSGGQTSRFKIREREVEYRRLRGEASCAECRRCKLKCDKRVPCSSCLRRGCQSICPNGSLANGHGSRFVFASTDKMQKKMLEMSQRIRQLEDGVQILSAATSANPHPLLGDEYLSIKSCNYDGVEEEKEEEDPEQPIELTDAFGTLAITDKGEVRFMGRVSSEALLLHGEPKNTEPPPDLPSEIMHTSDMFPFAPAHLPRAEILRMIESRLPSYQRATTHIEAYFVHVAWYSRLVMREQVFDEILPSVYRRCATGSAAAEKPDIDIALGRAIGGDYKDTVYVHRLALLFAILACGAAADLAMPVNNEEAQLYEQLARTGISLRSVFEGTSLESVQTVVLLSSYQFYTCRTLTFEPAWKTMIFGMTLGVSIGLHRDPSRWNMDSKLRERRRVVFWELFATDKWKSLESGRPSIFNLAEADCEFPADMEAGVGPDGTFRPSYWRWKHMFAKEVMGPVAEFMALAKAVRYSEILELDRKVREFNAKPIPAELLGSTTDMGSIIRRSTLGLYREIALLSLHRNFFARAMLEDPKKAVSGPFSASVLAAYACSISLLKLMRTHYVLQSPLLMRQWMIWIHSLIAGVIVGTVAVKKDHPAAVLCAQKELEAAIELFEHARSHPVARGGLTILHRLLDKSRYRSQFLMQSAASGLDSGKPTEALYDADGRSVDTDEELRILGGGARTVNLSTKSSSNIASATVVNLATALSTYDASPPSTGSGSSEAASSSSSHPTPRTLAEQPPLQSQLQQEKTGSKRGGGLFAVDSSAQSMFYTPSGGAYDTAGAGGPVPPEVVAERGAAAADALMAGEFDLILHNFTANNIGIGTGGDGMAVPPAVPSEAYMYNSRGTENGFPITAFFQSGELPQLPPLSDPMALFDHFPEAEVPQSIFNFGGTGTARPTDVDVDLDAILGLQTLEASNNNFDFLMDDVLSAANSTSRNAGNNFDPNPNVQGRQGSQATVNGSVPVEAWHALMGDLEKLQAANFAGDVPSFQ